MANMDQTIAFKMVNLTVPGAAGAPAATWTALTSGFKVKLTSTASTATASGTETPSGSGYVTGGTAVFGVAASAGVAATLPTSGSPLSWLNGSGSPWAIQSLELPDGAAVRTWFGNFTGAPVAIAIGNTFAIATAAVTVNDS
jgi:hypothetical protein